MLPLNGNSYDPPVFYKFLPSSQSLADLIDLYMNQKYDTNNGTTCKVKGSWVDPIGNSLKIKTNRAIMSSKGYVYHILLNLNREKFTGKVEGASDEPNIALRLQNNFDESNILFVVLACNIIYDQKKLLFTYGKLTHNPQPSLQFISFDPKDKPNEQIFNQHSQSQIDQNYKEECPLVGNWTDSQTVQLHIGVIN